MKRFHLFLFVLALVLCAAACACAADVRPLEPEHYDVDLKNGEFCLTVKDADRIGNGGWFTAALYLEDHYDAEQIKALASGDTVLVNGQSWTVQEVVPHLDGGNAVESYEIYTVEENDGYIVFVPSSDGCWLCVTDDWSPVSPVGDVRVMLPLPDRFEFYSGEDETPGDAEAFLNALEMYGDTFTAYNTACVFEDSMLVRVSHSSYPEGPAQTPGEDEAEETADAVPLWQFCHGVRDGLETAVITAFTTDCEIGLIPVEISTEETEEVRQMAMNGVVTDKANDESVTGGTWVYSFETPEGDHLLSIEMYRGLIVAVDGMYHYTVVR